jgi:hypothetical protein
MIKKNSFERIESDCVFKDVHEQSFKQGALNSFKNKQNPNNLCKSLNDVTEFLDFLNF